MHSNGRRIVFSTSKVNHKNNFCVTEAKALGNDMGLILGFAKSSCHDSNEFSPAVCDAKKSHRSYDFLNIQKRKKTIETRCTFILISAEPRFYLNGIYVAIELKPRIDTYPTDPSKDFEQL